ncbi:MAG TPA: GGDEF domain-containing protein, partial [Enterobacteriaceae bacterium]|nr:GGDEF domain-containing protein [Enterobacteriaceae bacterium]
ISHSYTDALTGLPNRRSLFENLPTLFSLARHLNRSVIIAYIDLDNFKVINDHYGHQAGDSFLQQIGQRLTSQRGSDDIVARLGGDEFLLAALGDSLDNRPHSDRVDTLKFGLDRQIQGEYCLGTSRIYYPGASIGVIEVDPQNIDTDSALSAADTAMYQVKKSKQKVPLSHIE